MANVYLAHDIILDRDVAVKILRIDLADESNLIRRFQREAQSATSLVHPNIVSVYDVGEENDLHYIVMEHVDGMDLKQYIQENHPISYDKAVDIMLQIVSAVAIAHQHHIIHRDLKPQNILIDHDGVVKLLILGLRWHFLKHPSPKRIPYLALSITYHQNRLAVGWQLKSQTSIRSELFYMNS